MVEGSIMFVTRMSKFAEIMRTGMAVRNRDPIRACVRTRIDLRADAREFRRFARPGRHATRFASGNGMPAGGPG
jgi:hypothetical protein